MSSKNKDPFHEDGVQGFLLVIGFIIVILFFTIVRFTNNLDVKDIEVSHFTENKCIKSRDGALLEDGEFKESLLVIKYTMESSDFDIFCYNEIIRDMKVQKLSNFWRTKFPSSSRIKWNDKEYIFRIPNKDFVVTDSNVNTLLEKY